MKWIMIALVVIGVVAAFSATMLVGSLRAGSGGGEADTTGVATREVLVAAHALSAMTIIDASAVAQQTVPLTDIPENAITSSVQLIGQVLLSQMVEGQMFVLDDLALGKSGVHLAMTLPDGGRAMSISLGADTGIAGWLYPGCLVDVIASFRVAAVRGAPAGEIASVTVLQSIRVLAIGSQSIVSPDAGAREQVSVVTGQKRSLVTLLVNAQEAEILQLAMGHGNVTLALRNPIDEGDSDSSGVLLSDMSEMLSRVAVMSGDDLAGEAMKIPEAVNTAQADPLVNTDAETSAAVVPELPIWTTIVLRGASVEEVTFVETESDSGDGGTDEVPQ